MWPFLTLSLKGVQNKLSTRQSRTGVRALYWDEYHSIGSTSTIFLISSLLSSKAIKEHSISVSMIFLKSFLNSVYFNIGNLILPILEISNMITAKTRGIYNPSWDSIHPFSHNKSSQKPRSSYLKSHNWAITCLQESTLWNTTSTKRRNQQMPHIKLRY